MNGMGRPTYYCHRCKRNHFYTSKTGRLHRGGFARSSTSRKQKRQPPPKRPRSRGVRQKTQIPTVLSPGREDRRPGSSPVQRWSRRRDNARQVVDSLSGTAASTVAVIVFDPGSRYQLMADEILARMPWYRGANRGHWICRRLEDAAKALSPGTYLERANTTITKELVVRGVPRFAAQVIARSLTAVTGRAIGSLGTDQLITTLRAIVPLVCPNFERCPAQQSVCTHFVAPGVEETLRSVL